MSPIRHSLSCHRRFAPQPPRQGHFRIIHGSFLRQDLQDSQDSLGPFRLVFHPGHPVHPVSPSFPRSLHRLSAKVLRKVMDRCHRAKSRTGRLRRPERGSIACVSSRGMTPRAASTSRIPGHPPPPGHRMGGSKSATVNLQAPGGGLALRQGQFQSEFPVGLEKERTTLWVDLRPNACPPFPSRVTQWVTPS